MVLGKVSHKEFGWPVECSVSVGALSVSFQLINSVNLSCGTHKNEGNVCVCPHESCWNLDLKGVQTLVFKEHCMMIKFIVISNRKYYFMCLIPNRWLGIVHFVIMCDAKLDTVGLVVQVDTAILQYFQFHNIRGR